MADNRLWLNIGVGTDLRPYKVDLSSLTRGLVVVGQSGCGKSFLIGRIIEEIIRVTTNSRVLVFDTNSDFYNGLTLKKITDFKKSLIKYESYYVEDYINDFVKEEVKLYNKLKIKSKSFKQFGRVEKFYLPTDLLFEEYEYFLNIVCANDHSVDYRHALLALSHFRKDKRTIDLFKLSEIAVQLLQLKKGQTETFNLIDKNNKWGKLGLDLTLPQTLTRLNNDITDLKKSGLWKSNLSQKGILDSLFDKNRINFIDYELIVGKKNKDILTIMILLHLKAGAKEAIDKVRKLEGKATKKQKDNQESNLEHTFIVLDEAQNYAMLNPQTPHERMLGDILHQIAAEGRKYGLHLILGTQRPNKVKAGLLGECDNAIIMKMNSRSDLEQLSDQMRILDVKLLEPCLHFQGTGNALAVGEMTGMAPYTCFFKSAPRRTIEGGVDIDGF